MPDDQRGAQNALALKRLRALLDSAAREAAATQRILQEHAMRFAAVSDEVINVVGGSANRDDQAMVASLHTAIGHSNTAITALSAAARSRP